MFSAAQAIQVGRIGARFVSPFIGWKEANGEHTKQFVEEVRTIYRNYSFSTEIIVAAVRNAMQIVDAAVAGADIVTAGYAVYEDSFAHPFWDAVRQSAASKAAEMRRQGFSGAAMLPMSELEYTGVTEKLESLDKRFRIRS